MLLSRVTKISEMLSVRGFFLVINAYFVVGSEEGCEAQSYCYLENC